MIRSHRTHRLVHSTAFTLIELLVVIGIIAILASIALPNFLEAQTRSKVARAQSDLRTIATAFEAYYVDNNHYPPDWNSQIYGIFPPLGEWKTYENLSSPVAYITSAPMDPFRDRHGESDDFYEYYGLDANEFYDANGIWQKHNIQWVVYSFGPDTQNQQLGSYVDSVKSVYDPTNGTISFGDVGRSNKGVIIGE